MRLPAHIATAAAAATVAGFATSALPLPVVNTVTANDAVSATSRALIGPASDHEMHVMSVNVRMDFGAQGPPDGWKNRLPILAELLDRERPTLIGAQEILFPMLKQIRSRLPGAYDSLGMGTEGGSKGQFNMIFYDTTRLEVMEFGHFWLSGTPAEIGSSTWGNRDFMRMATWARFRDRIADEEFYHLNTHLDHQVGAARERSARLIKERIGSFKRGLPVVVTGDFNAPAGDSAPYRVLTGKGGLSDAWKISKKRLTPDYGTFPNYGPVKKGARRIDWILTRGFDVRSIGHNAFRMKGHYPSDHLPVQVALSVKA